jgi:hypothetical protein
MAAVGLLSRADIHFGKLLQSLFPQWKQAFFVFGLGGRAF